MMSMTDWSHRKAKYETVRVYKYIKGEVPKVY